MGQLKEGASYIYENADGIIYSREFGAPANSRKIIGMTAEKSNLLVNQIRDNQLWHEIRRAAETNPTIQRALEQCIILYKLSEEYENRHGNRKT